MSSSSGSPQEVEKRTGLAGVPLVVATAAILIWAIFLVIMLLASNTAETQWARMTYVFASVEAIAFAAAGALFGVTVQRERVKSAEESAERNARDAANGRALAIASIADAGGAGENPEAYAFGNEVPTDVRGRHAELARRLFPDLP